MIISRITFTLLSALLDSPFVAFSCSFYCLLVTFVASAHHVFLVLVAGHPYCIMLKCQFSYGLFDVISVSTSPRTEPQLNTHPKYESTPNINLSLTPNHNHNTTFSPTPTVFSVWSFFRCWKHNITIFDQDDLIFRIKLPVVVFNQFYFGFHCPHWLKSHAEEA